MKKFAVLLATLAAGIGSGSVFAQTCGSPTSIAGSAPFSISGNSCTSPTGTGVDSLTDICNSTLPIGTAPDVVYQISLGAGNNTSFTVTPTGWDASLFLVGPGSCGPSANCAGAAESGGSGVAETIPAASQTAGTYYVVVTDRKSVV